MAYSESAPPTMIAEPIGGGLGVWVYSTTDSGEAVGAAGYFTNGGGLGMEVGQVVVVVNTAVSFASAHYVSAISAAGAATIAPLGTPEIEWFGAVGDGVADDRAAFVSADAAGLTHIRLRAGQTYRIGSSVSIDAHVEFAGGKISADSGATVTLAGGYTAHGPAQTFTGSGTFAITKPQTISPQHWGATNNGAADDATAFLACLNAATGHVVDLLGWHFLISAQLAPTSSNVEIVNGVIDNSAAPDETGNEIMLKFAGSDGSPETLTGNVAEGEYVIPIADTSAFAVDGWVWLASDAVWDVSENADLGWIARVRAINADTSLELWETVPYALATADNATVTPVTLCEGVKVRGVEFVGAADNDQFALQFDRCDAPLVEDCKFTDYEHIGVHLRRCVNATVRGSEFRSGTGASTAYGVQDAGSLATKMEGCSGFDLRHLYTGSDNEGISRLAIVQGCTGHGLRNAAVDTHTSSDLISILGNSFSFSAQSATAGDGIFVESPRATIQGNTLRGVLRHAIAARVEGDIVTPSIAIHDNVIFSQGGASAERAIYVQTVDGPDVVGVSIEGNHLHGATAIGIEIDADAANITGLAIIGNIYHDAPASLGLYLNTTSGKAISDFTIMGNVILTGGSSAFYMLGGAADGVTSGVISGNFFDGGSTAIRFGNTSDVTVGRNNYGSHPRRFLTATSTGLTLDREGVAPTAVTDLASYTVLPEDAELIVSRAAGSCTLTLPAVTEEPGRVLHVRTIQAQTVVSNASNVVPLAGGAAGTAICAGTAGTWARLVNDGSNHLITAA